MYAKIVTLALTSSLLFSCQQAVTKQTEEAASELMAAKSGITKIAPKHSSIEVDLKQLSFTATVKYMNLEGGFFGLIDKDGKHWLPMNLKKEFQQHGAIIKVTGSALDDIMTIQQWGTPFSITHIELIKAGQSEAGSDVM